MTGYEQNRDASQDRPDVLIATLGLGDHRRYGGALVLGLTAFRNGKRLGEPPVNLQTPGALP